LQHGRIGLRLASVRKARRTRNAIAITRDIQAGCSQRNDAEAILSGMFDRYVTVDWSASNSPKTGKDSIWICDLRKAGDLVTTNPSTRREAEEQLRELLLQAADHRERVLIGFDFPYGYPRGLAAALGLEGPAWSAIWRYLEGHVQDARQTNENNRFEVASAINARLVHHAFWGRPAARQLNSLSMRRDQVHYRIEGEAAGLDEWREVEELLRRRRTRPQSAWKLLGAGSVGSQALTGIPVLYRLRHDSRLEAISRVWPFEVKVPELPDGQGAVIHAEIWPSLEATPYQAGFVRDEAQVISLAQVFRNRDGSGTLNSIFSVPSPAAAEEGWILGVAD
jgi:precorrin-8X/cobalt-precorrin-8 methylmutase